MSIWYKFGIRSAEEIAASKGADRMSKMDPKTFVANVQALPRIFQLIFIYIIQYPGTTVVVAQMLGEAIKLSPLNDELEHGLASSFELVSEGMQRFLEIQAAAKNMPLADYQKKLIREINTGVDIERHGEGSAQSDAGPMLVRKHKDGREILCLNAHSPCKYRTDDEWPIDTQGNFKKMVDANHGIAGRLDTPLCEFCFKGAHKEKPTAAHLTVIEVAPEKPLEMPNWIQQIDPKKHGHLTGLYMAAQDHITYDAAEKKPKASIGFKDGGKEESSPATTESQKDSAPSLNIALVLIIAVLASVICVILAIFGQMLIASAIAAVLALVALVWISKHSATWLWRVTAFKDVSSDRPSMYENLDGLAFRLAHGLEWMARYRPYDLNQLLDENVSFDDARKNATEKITQIVPAVILTTKGAKGFPFWVPLADMADVAIQMPTIRRWFRAAFMNGGRIAVIAATLFMGFVLFPLVIIYVGLLFLAFYLLANGVATFFYAFGAIESRSIWQMMTTFLGLANYTPAIASVTEDGYRVVYFASLFYATAQIWIFRFLIVGLEAPIEPSLTGAKHPNISRHSGREHMLVSIFRSVNNYLPEKMKIDIAAPIELNDEELHMLKRSSGNPRVKHLALIAVLISAVTAFVGFGYLGVTSQEILGSVIMCFVLSIAIPAEATVLLGFLMPDERKVKQAKLVLGLLFVLPILAGLALAVVGGATSFSTTRLYDVMSGSFNEWAESDSPSSKARSAPAPKKRQGKETPMEEMERLLNE
jgi:hypothetical protein